MAGKRKARRQVEIEFNAKTRGLTAELRNVTKSVKKVGKSFEKSLDRQTKTLKDMKDGWTQLKSQLELVGMAFKLIGNSVKFFADMAQLAAEQSTQIEQMAEVMEMRGLEDGISRIHEWTAEMQSMTRFGDTETRSVVTLLAQSTDGLTLSMEQLLAGSELVFDIVESQGKTAEEVTRAIAKVFTGNTEAINELIPGLRDQFTVINTIHGGAENSVTRANLALQAMGDTLSGSRHNLSAYDQGIANIVNTWGDLKETLGETVVEAVEASGMLGNIVLMVEEWQSYIIDNKDDLVDLFYGAADGAQELAGTLVDVLGHMRELANLISDPAGSFSRAIFAGIERRVQMATMPFGDMTWEDYQGGVSEEQASREAIISGRAETILRSYEGYSGPLSQATLEAGARVAALDAIGEALTSEQRLLLSLIEVGLEDWRLFESRQQTANLLFQAEQQAQAQRELAQLLREEQESAARSAARRAERARIREIQLEKERLEVARERIAINDKNSHEQMLQVREQLWSKHFGFVADLHEDFQVGIYAMASQSFERTLNDALSMFQGLLSSLGIEEGGQVGVGGGGWFELMYAESTSALLEHQRDQQIWADSMENTGSIVSDSWSDSIQQMSMSIGGFFVNGKDAMDDFADYMKDSFASTAASISTAYMKGALAGGGLGMMGIGLMFGVIAGALSGMGSGGGDARQATFGPDVLTSMALGGVGTGGQNITYQLHAGAVFTPSSGAETFAEYATYASEHGHMRPGGP